MAGKAGTLEVLAQQLGLALLPLENELASGNVIQLFADLGLQFPPQLLTQANFTHALTTASTAASQLSGLLTQLANDVAADNETAIVQNGLQLVGQIGTLASALGNVGTELGNAAGSLPGMNAAEVAGFAQSLASNLLSFMVISYLKELQPGAAGLANLLGILDYLPQPGVPGDPTHPPFTIRKLQLSKLGDIFTKPLDLFNTLYGWGDNSFNGSKLIPRLKTSLNLLGLSSPVELPAASDILHVSQFSLEVDSSSLPPGLVASLRYPISSGLDLTIPLSDVWSVEVVAQGSFDAGLQATIFPPAKIDLKPPTGTLTGQLSMKLQAAGPDANHPLILIGQSGGSRLVAQRLGAKLGITANWNASANKARVEPVISASVTSGNLILDLSQGDGFVEKLTSGLKVEAGLDFDVAWGLSSGARFQGSSGLEIQFPFHLSLGPVEISALTLSVGFQGKSFPVGLAVDLKAALGPLVVVVENVGFKVDVALKDDHKGNAGPVDLQFGFKPPRGAGLSINAGIVKGGGYLSFDPDHGEYAGAMELEIADFLALKAIGLITTRMPDGSSGFSLLIIITAEFAEGIQLGFGFTLLGVGGLLGVNREMKLQALVDGVRTGGIESMMFPHDVVANAQRIISDLRAFFPPKEGTFLIGPMAKIGWGEPMLISVTLGIIMEVPPVDIALLGTLKLALPADDVALIVIQVNFIGALELDKKRFFFFASLFGSRVLFMPIEGEMGVLMAFGDDANFVVSIGGFHPQFNPPPLPFPSPKRIAINILNQELARIRVEGYFAVTSNSVQFGAHADLFFGFDAINVKGNVGFDALIQFSPFHFLIEATASLSVTVFGFGLFSIDLDLSLDGPTPWHAHGTAKFKVLLFTVHVSIDVTWGQSQDTTLPPINVMPILASELAKRSNWRAVLPTGSNLLVSLRTIDPAEADLVLHPVGTLRVSQRAVPVDLTLDKVGSQKPGDANRFSLDVASGGLLVKTNTLQERFAPAQFKNFGDAERLSQQAYAPMDSGVELSASQAYASGTAVTRFVRYDLKILDSALQPKLVPFFQYSGTLFYHFVGGGSVARSVLSADTRGKLQPFADKVIAGPETFAVARQSNNTVYAPEAAAFSSQAAANDYLARAVATDPSLGGQLHVLPQFEVAA